MKNKLLFILIILVFIPFSYSLCSQGQINVNTASLSELDKIYGIGPAKAQAVIDARPYNSLEDLVDAKGIGSVTLEDIKAEGLACVEIEEDSEDEEITEENFEVEETDNNEVNTIEEKEEEDEKTFDKTNNQISSFSESEGNSISTNTPKRVNEKIFLNSETPKTIKSKENSFSQDDKRYSLYALVIFCIFLVFLFILDKNKKGNKRKNEFRKYKN